MQLTEHLAAYCEHRIYTSLQDKKLVISFDFDETILLPKLQEEPNYLFFTTGRKIDIFSLNNEGTNIQTTLSISASN